MLLKKKRLLKYPNDKVMFTESIVNEGASDHFICFHRELSYHREYSSFIQYIEDNDLKVNVSYFDYLGHGKSGGARAHLGEKDLLEGILLFLKKIGDEFPNDRFHFISQGFGGCLAVNLLSNYGDQIPFKVSSSIYCNPLFAPKLFSQKTTINILNKIENTFGRVKLPVHFNAWDLSYNQKIAKSEDYDYLVSKSISIGFISSILEQSQRLKRNLKRYSINSLFFFSENDLNDSKKSKEMIASVESQTIYDLDRFNYVIFNEKKNKAVFEQIFNWIQK